MLCQLVFFVLSLASFAYSQCTPSLHFFNPKTGNEFLTVTSNARVAITSLTTPFEVRAEFCRQDIKSAFFSIVGEDELNAEFESTDRVDNTAPFTSGVITNGAISRIREALKFGEAQFLIAGAFDQLKAQRNIVANVGIEFVLTTKTRITPPPLTTPTPSSAPNPFDLPPSPFSISLVSPSASTFNGPGPLIFEISGTTFRQPLQDNIFVLINTSPVSNSDITLTPTRLTVSEDATSDVNRVEIFAIVSSGGVASFSGTISTGTGSVTVDLVDSLGNPFLTSTTVTATLLEDVSVQAVVSTDTGSATFNNVAGPTISIQAISENNDVGKVLIQNSNDRATIEVLGFSEPSSVENNDLSLGLAGWEFPNMMVAAIIPHIEEVGPDADPDPEPEPSLPFDFPPFETPPIPFDFPIESPNLDEFETVRQVENRDLSLTTQDTLLQEVSRTFQARFGTTGVRVRYRFVSEEISDGFFFIGSDFNDFFEVSIRSRIADGRMAELTSVSGIGIPAFGPVGGSTDWRELILRLDEDFETVEVRASVANVGDELFDSQVSIDFVEELGCNLGEPVKRPFVGMNILERAKELAIESNTAAIGTGLQGARNGRLDAFRQCLWSCRMAQELGQFQAKRVGDFHEICGGNPEAERLMDLRNNEVGRELRSGNCSASCLEGVSNGELQISL